MKWTLGFYYCLLILLDICNSESDKDACLQCNCSQNEANKIFILNCAEKGLQQILDSYGNLFGTGNGTIDKFVDITYSGNVIKSLNRLPETLAKLSFSCRNCELANISIEAFASTPNILILDLSFNQMNGKSIHSELFRGYTDNGTVQQINLLQIDLSYNVIESLQLNSFKYIRQLKRLSLAGNPLMDLDNDTILTIASLNNLVRLDLSFTGLSQIPDELFNETMPQLRELRLEGNRLLAVPGSLSLLGKTLRTLYIGSNPIGNFIDDNFLGLKHLLQLSIDNMTELITIHAGTFSSLPALEILNCSNNVKLLEFDLGYLSWSPYLREIYVSNCSLKSLLITIPNIAPINESDSLPLNRLRFMKLDNNPWHCDCDLYKSLERIKRHNNDLFTHNGGARCETPYDLVSDLFTDLTVDTSCRLTNIKKPNRIPAIELPPFLRPRSILVTILSVLTVIIIGLCIGLIIVHVKKKLLNSDLGFTQPIRYTTVRNSINSIQQ